MAVVEAAWVRKIRFRTGLTVSSRSAQARLPRSWNRFSRENLVSMLAPRPSLPLSGEYTDVESYVEDLLQFVTTSSNLQTLCGGVHILDFLTRESDLYEAVLPTEWRAWLNELDIAEVLDFLMREDLALREDADSSECHANGFGLPLRLWERHGNVPPPASLITYLHTIRKLSLNRDYDQSARADFNPSKSVTAGMNRKKLHEVEHFASFVDQLASRITQEHNLEVSHLVDFGSGQNYLGRVLASPPFTRRVVAIERRSVNIDGAQRKDLNAKLLKKESIWRNKKLWRSTGVDDAEEVRQEVEAQEVGNNAKKQSIHPTISCPDDAHDGSRKIMYVQHSISNGDLSDTVSKLVPVPPNLLVMSLHSCGNLIHHGLRSLVLNPSVKAVALVGCCYNLCTERLGFLTYKLPNLRTATRRLEETSTACDPHGFPMSKRFVDYKHADSSGIRFNITARMMAVQAPQNWTQEAYESFFTRHFYRALLQRIFLDRGLIEPPENSQRNKSAAGAGSGGEPIIIGSLRKSDYTCFVHYARGALRKLSTDPAMAPRIQKTMEGLSDADIAAYEERYLHRRHHLCILWSLMAFSAAVMESAMVVDRWLYLEEQDTVDEAWVQTVFEYEKSPRNLVVVGIKK